MGGKRALRHATEAALEPILGLPAWAPMAAWFQALNPSMTDEQICVACGLSPKSRPHLSRLRKDPRYQDAYSRAWMAGWGVAAIEAIQAQRREVRSMTVAERTDYLRALLPVLAKSIPAQVSLDASIDVSGGLRLDLATATQDDLLSELRRLAAEDPAVRGVLAGDGAE